MIEIKNATDCHSDIIDVYLSYLDISEPYVRVVESPDTVRYDLVAIQRIQGDDLDYGIDVRREIREDYL